MRKLEIEIEIESAGSLRRTQNVSRSNSPTDPMEGDLKRAIETKKLGANISVGVGIAMLDRATREYGLIEHRIRILGKQNAVGPAWHMLLDLCISNLKQQKLSVSSLCIGAKTSSATALRHIARLESDGLIERVSDVDDARRSFVRLTKRGWQTVREALS